MKTLQANKDKVNQLIELLPEAFSWSSTQEGYGYWRIVFQRLKSLAEQAPRTHDTVTQQPNQTGH